MNNQTIIFVLVMASSITCFDYSIPKLPIQSTLSSSQHYYLNNIQYDHDQDIVRIKLASVSDSSSYNIYNYEVIELENYTKIQSDQGNGMCSVVKVLDNNPGFSKYLLNYHINSTKQAHKQEDFITTTYIAQKKTYRQKIVGTVGNEVIENQSKFIVYSLTSKLSLHKVTVQDTRLHITTQEGKFAGNDKTVKTQIFKYGQNPNPCLEIDLYQLDGQLIISCIQDQSIKLSYVSTNDKLWDFKSEGSATVSLTNNSYIQTKKLEGNGKDRLFLLTESSLHQIQQQQGKLIITQLSVENATKFSRISPIYMSHSSVKVPYLIVCGKEGLILYNVQTGKVQHRQNFNGLINMQTIQHVSYALNNIKIHNTKGVIQLVVVEGRRQLIVQIFHECSWAGSQSVHQLHVNKIYHNYHANTKHPYNYDDEDYSNINTIQKIQYPSISAGFNNNVGLLQSKNKLVFFQYGIPRTISPEATAASQFIKEQTYTNIVDVAMIPSTAPVEIDKTYDDAWISKQVQKIKNNKIWNPESTNIVAYIVTLNKYINIMQINPRHLYHFEYVCNLDWNSRTNQLNTVKIRMESLCEQNVNGDTAKLVYCEKQQVINFHLTDKSIQQQRDQAKHIVFVCLAALLLTAIGVVALLMWRRLKREDEKLKILKNERRIKLMENSKLDHSVLAE